MAISQFGGSSSTGSSRLAVATGEVTVRTAIIDTHEIAVSAGTTSVAEVITGFSMYREEDTTPNFHRISAKVYVAGVVVAVASGNWKLHTASGFTDFGLNSELGIPVYVNAGVVLSATVSCSPSETFVANWIVEIRSFPVTSLRTSL